MKHVILIHWKPEVAAARLEQLRRAGYRAEIPAIHGAQSVRAWRSHPPDAFVIDLARMPSAGLAVATLLRQQKATRRVPIVFAGGEPAKVARARLLLPDAVYADWSGIRTALRPALSMPLEEPVVPGTMDGYSGTPLPKKLGIREGSEVALLNAPTGFARELTPLPGKVRLRKECRTQGDVVLLFAKSRKELARRLALATRAMRKGGRLWLAWPKQASGKATDLKENMVRAIGLGAGLVDYKICAINATWSGLCFARRSRRRPAAVAKSRYVR